VMIKANGFVWRKLFKPYLVIVQESVLCVVYEHRCCLERCPFAICKSRSYVAPYPDKWKCTQTAPADPETIREHLKRRRLGFPHGCPTPTSTIRRNVLHVTSHMLHNIHGKRRIRSYCN
jgi:hypothetical protein